MSGTEVLALSLGRITVQSALGEPLRAEIDIPDINAEEAASLRTNVAAPEAFTAAGLEYNPAMSGVQAVLSRRPDGRAYIKLNSQRSVNDPFVDMIIEASWSSGRIVRDYTMLFDPPSLKQAAAAPTLPQITAPASVASKPAQVETVRAAPVAPKPALAATPSQPAPTAAARPAPQAVAGSGQQITVKPGDSASKIANAAKAGDVSLDQMLVALIRSNPDAFSNGNLNRLRAGAVLDLPSADQAKSVSTTEATQMVVAQSKDFNDFRRKLAAGAPKANVEATDRQASGKLEAKVDDKKSSGTTPDKLTLSKGTVKSAANDAKIAKDLADKEAAARAAELAKNIAELNKVRAADASKATAAASPAPAASQAKASVAPAIPVATAPPVAEVTKPASAPAAPVSAPAPTPVAAASTAAPPKPVAATAAPLPVEEPGILGDLLSDPILPAAGGGLIALLGGFVFYRQRQRKKNAAHVDSSFLESRLQPDSFFGASGGQRVDTANEAAVSGSSMVYSPSQLDAADDVDPVAEADVYLAYGRDVQAEEILKEAVKHNPGRLAIHTKLLEIFAKRRDAASFQASATQVFKLAGGESPEWARVCEMGLGIDPENPLYQPGGASLSAFGSLESTPAPLTDGNSTVAMAATGSLEGDSGAMDLDLDLDFSADDAPAGVAATEETVKMHAETPPAENSLDFDISGPGELSSVPGDLPTTPSSMDLPELPVSMDGLNLDLGAENTSLQMPDFVPTGTLPTEAMTDAEPPPSKDGMLEFDLGTLSLDLDSNDSTHGESISGEDPLETKLALADEFVSIGDNDGARALIEEVVAEATGELRDKAQRALANLS